MTDQEKEQEIEALQIKKEALSPELKKVCQEKNIAFERYTKANNNWMELKTEWENLDRKEKLLSFSMIGNKTVERRTTKSIEAKATEKALKSLNNLPPEIRKQILANFK